MAYYRICPRCGCNLDPGEHCDCEDEKSGRMNFIKTKRELKRKQGRWYLRSVRGLARPTITVPHRNIIRRGTGGRHADEGAVQ